LEYPKNILKITNPKEFKFGTQLDTGNPPSWKILFSKVGAA